MCETFDTEYTEVYSICKEVTEALEKKDSKIYSILEREDSLIIDYVAQEEEYHDEEEEEE